MFFSKMCSPQEAGSRENEPKVPPSHNKIGTKSEALPKGETTANFKILRFRDFPERINSESKWGAQIGPLMIFALVPPLVSFAFANENKGATILQNEILQKGNLKEKVVQ